MLRRKRVACERKNLEVKVSMSPFSGLATFFGALGPRAMPWPEAPAGSGLDYAGLSGQAFDALPLYVTFDCTPQQVLTFQRGCPMLFSPFLGVLSFHFEDLVDPPRPYKDNRFHSDKEPP